MDYDIQTLGMDIIIHTDCMWTLKDWPSRSKPMKCQMLMNIDTEKFTKIFTKYIYKKYIHIYKNKKYIQKKYYIQQNLQ